MEVNAQGFGRLLQIFTEIMKINLKAELGCDSCNIEAFVKYTFNWYTL